MRAIGVGFGAMGVLVGFMGMACFSGFLGSCPVDGRLIAASVMLAVSGSMIVTLSLRGEK